MAWSEWKTFSSGLSVFQGLINNGSGTITHTFDKDSDTAYVIAGVSMMSVKLNGETIAIRSNGGYTLSDIGLYYSNPFSVKKGDTISISTTTGSKYEYLVFY